MGEPARTCSGPECSLCTTQIEDDPLYGQNSKVVIDVLSITPVTDTTAQVRFTKTWVSDGEGVPDRIGKFTATVTYRFEPSKQTALDLVWQNPTGFLVTDYRITAETLAPTEE
jgi:type IV secretion system protein VirB8